MEINKNNDISSYRSIFKATSLFGGVQAYQILVGVIKSKIIAVLLGTMGVGVLGLLTSATDLIKTITSMGLQSSAVRDISEANGSKDNDKISIMVSVLRYLVRITGIFGMVVVMILSPWLSKLSFRNYDYTVPFIFLSVTLLIDQLFAGQKIILQGMRKMRELAKASAIGATFGLLSSIPCYYLLGIHGIVPTLILTSLFNLLFAWLFAKNINLKVIKLSNRQIFHEGSNMLKMGLAMSFTGILSTLTIYIVRSYVSYFGGVDDVGLYSAGFTLMTTYTGLVFAAISTDYYPRLASINKENDKCKVIINQQGEIGVLILSPLLLICMVFVPIIVPILYSNRFLPANGYIVWAASGMLFKMAAWSISYVFVAKAESNLFAIVETMSNIISLCLSLCGYRLWGLTGLGIAFSVGYFIYFLIVYTVARIKYDFHFLVSFKKIFLYQSGLLYSCLICVMLMPLVCKYVIGMLLIINSVYISIRELNKRILIFDYLKKNKWIRNH